MGKGWVAIDRSILNHWIWEDKPFSKGQAWVDLLLMVNHADNKILFDGELITVGRGSTVTSTHKLSERWGWSRKKSSKFLDLLEKDKMLTQKRTNRCTTITIEKYDFYQSIGNTKEPVKNQSGTSVEPVKNTNNNDNNDNNVSNDYFDVFWDAFPKKVSKAAAQKTFNKIRVDNKLLNKMLIALEAQIQSKQWSDKQYIPYPATWLNQRRWEDEIETDSNTGIGGQLIPNTDGSFSLR